uniref:Bm1213 n=1 Tax=Brugia malayi TaxID=6279 RepID=A0A1I9G0T3_BRUMA|nr:Bm1213 [Brugia malayi]
MVTFSLLGTVIAMHVHIFARMSSIKKKNGYFEDTIKWLFLRVFTILHYIHISYSK